MAQTTIDAAAQAALGTANIRVSNQPLPQTGVADSNPAPDPNGAPTGSGAGLYVTSNNFTIANPA